MAATPTKESIREANAHIQRLHSQVGSYRHHLVTAVIVPSYFATLAANGADDAWGHRALRYELNNKHGDCCSRY